MDVHHRFPGIGTAPDPSFVSLWGRRERARVGGAGVWFSDWSTRALLVALNTARTRHSAQAARDLALLVEPAAQVDWDYVALRAVQLARRAGAAGGPRAGGGRGGRW